MEDLSDLFAELNKELNDPSNDSLSEIARLAEQQVKLESLIEDLEQHLDVAKKAHARISQQELPDRMAEVGLSEFKLTSGRKITIKPFYSGKITADHHVEAITWLLKNGHDGIIKNEISMSYGKGEDATADKDFKLLYELGLHPQRKEFVHPQTLKAWIKEMVTKNETFPHDLFSVYVGRVTHIK